MYDIKEKMSDGVHMKKLTLYLLVLCVFLMGCSIQKDDEKKLRDIDYTVTPKEDLPEELQTMIGEKEKDPFELTYGENGYLYVARGYGSQPTSGYSIRVDSCYESSNSIWVTTTLEGPQKGNQTVEEETFPCIVLKMEYSEKGVIFE